MNIPEVLAASKPTSDPVSTSAVHAEISTVVVDNLRILARLWRVPRSTVMETLLEFALEKNGLKMSLEQMKALYPLPVVQTKERKRQLRKELTGG